VTVAPAPPVAPAQPSPCHAPSQQLTDTERRYAEAAWQYFKTNTQSTGLVNDRSDFKGATLWGMGDYLTALHAARMLEIIPADEFDKRVRQLLGAVSKLPLFAGELPNRSYDTWSLQPVDYGDNPTSEGTGWSALDVGRLLSALYLIKTCHPEYTAAIDPIPLDWSYLQVVRNGLLFSTKLSREGGRSLTRLLPETRLGYEEYAARAFQLWGFAVDRAAVGTQYQTSQVEGVAVPVQRNQAGATANSFTVSNPFLLYGLEYGLDPQMRSLVQPLFQAQAARYSRTHTLTAAATTLLDRSPYVVHSSVIAGGEAWATLSDDGKAIPDLRIISTAAAFAFDALFPDEPYAHELQQAIANSANPTQGYPEGLVEKTGQQNVVYAAETNSLILQSLLYKKTNRQPTIHLSAAMSSPWWQAIASGNLDRGLPTANRQTAQLVTDTTGTYWVSTGARSTADSAPAQNASVSNASVSPVSNSPASPSNPAPSKPQAELQSRLPLDKPSLIAAKNAWKYFEQNWNSQTGLVNAVDQLPWATLWDQVSALLGIHAAKQLGLVASEQFNQKMNVLLNTLETLPVPATQLPNKAYSTHTAQMRQLDNVPDPNGISGWSALDTARFLVGLKVIKTHYPEYTDRIDRIVSRWNLPKLIHDGWLYGGISTPKGIHAVQEGRLGYEQYAALGLKLWGIEATNALSKPPTKTVQVDGLTFQVDQRDLRSSGATNYLTSDPYLL
jgi:hypothetical protein